MKKTLLFALVLTAALNVSAQLSSTDVFKSDVALTFLGLDFTQTKFIGDASQWKDAGAITNKDFAEKYIPAWNDMFKRPSEQKNFRLAEATGRTEVAYATEITQKMNRTVLKKEFFSEKADDYPHLNEGNIGMLVRRYNFEGKEGLGLIFFVEGMRKVEEKGEPSYATVWVTFVDMSKKTVVSCKRIEGKAGGFGFRNFWAGAWKNVIKEMKGAWNGKKKGK